jgi:hypothetical protein
MPASLQDFPDRHPEMVLARRSETGIAPIPLKTSHCKENDYENDRCAFNCRRADAGADAVPGGCSGFVDHDLQAVPRGRRRHDQDGADLDGRLV